MKLKTHLKAGGKIMDILKISIFPLSEKTFLASYTHPVSRRRVRVPFPSEKEAREFGLEIIKKFDRDNLNSGKPLTLEQLSCFFVQDRPNSNFFKTKNIHAVDFIQIFGNYFPEEVTTAMLKSWLEQIKRERSVQICTIESIRISIASLFIYLVKKKIIDKSPLGSFRYQRILRVFNPKNILTTQETTELLERVKLYSPGYLYPIIRIFSETAAKTAEVINLNWNDIDFKAGAISFRKIEKIQSRKIKVSHELIKLLSRNRRKSERLFTTYRNQPFTPKKLMMDINEFIKKTKYPRNLTPAHLRHSFAINFLTGGGDIRELQRTLGHKRVNITRNTYGKATAERINQMPFHCA